MKQNSKIEKFIESLPVVENSENFESVLLVSDSDNLGAAGGSTNDECTNRDKKTCEYSINAICDNYNSTCGESENSRICSNDKKDIPSGETESGTTAPALP